MSKILLIILSLFIICTPFSSSAESISCKNTNKTNPLETARYIFEGTVTSYDKYQGYEIAITKKWKGNMGESSYLKNSLWNPIKLELGSEWLFLTNDINNFEVNPCARYRYSVPEGRKALKDLENVSMTSYTIHLASLGIGLTLVSGMLIITKNISKKK